MVLTGNWATKYGYFSTLEGTANDPTSINYGGSCNERIENLRRRGYGLYSNIGQRYSIVYWQQNCSRLTEEYRLSKIQKENERLLNVQKQKDEQLRLIQEEEMFEDLLRKQLENERKQNEIKRKEITKVQPVIIPETIPIVTPEIIPIVKPETSVGLSLIPLSIIAFLVLK